MATTTTFGGAVYLSFNGESIALSTNDLKSINFAYHAESFREAIAMGTPAQAVEAILVKFANAPTTWETIKGKLDEFGQLPVIGPVVTKLMAADVVITDFVINQPDGVYQFGIGLRFTNEPPSIGPITLDGFAVKVTLIIANTPPPAKLN